MASSMTGDRAAQILGVSSDCRDINTLRNAYRAAVRDASPEKKNGSGVTTGSVNGRSKFQEISAAYSFLSLHAPKVMGGGAKSGGGGKKKKRRNNAATAASMRYGGATARGSSCTLTHQSTTAVTGGNSSEECWISPSMAADLAQMWAHRELLSRADFHDSENLMNESFVGDDDDDNDDDIREASKAASHGLAKESTKAKKKNGLTKQELVRIAGRRSKTDRRQSDVVSDAGVDIATAAAAAAAMGFMHPDSSVGRNGEVTNLSDFWSQDPRVRGSASTANSSQDEMKALMSMFVEFMGMFSPDQMTPPSFLSHGDGADENDVDVDLGESSFSNNSHIDIDDIDPEFLHSLRMSLPASMRDACDPSSPDYPALFMMLDGTGRGEGKYGSRFSEDAFDKWVEYCNADPDEFDSVDYEDGDGTCSYNYGLHGAAQSGSKQNTLTTAFAENSNSSTTGRMTMTAFNKFRDAMNFSDRSRSRMKSNAGVKYESQSKQSSPKNGHHKGRALSLNDHDLNSAKNPSVVAVGESDVGTPNYDHDGSNAIHDEAEGIAKEMSSNDDNEDIAISAADDDDRMKKAEKKREKKSRKKEKAKQEAAERVAQAAKKRREAKIVSWRSRVVTACTAGEVAKLDILLGDSPFKKQKSLPVSGVVGIGTRDDGDDCQSLASSEFMTEHCSEVAQHMEWLLRVCQPRTRKAILNAHSNERDARQKVAEFAMETAFNAVFTPGKSGRNALHIACQMNDHAFVRAVVHRATDAKGELRRLNGSQAALPQSVHCQMDNDNESSVGSNVLLDSLCEDSGWSPLHYAVASGASECIEELLSSGCNVTCLTNSDLTRKSSGEALTASELGEEIMKGTVKTHVECLGRGLQEVEAFTDDLQTNKNVKLHMEDILCRLKNVEIFGYSPAKGGVAASDERNFTEAEMPVEKGEKAFKSVYQSTDTNKKKKNCKKIQEVQNSVLKDAITKIQKNQELLPEKGENRAEVDPLVAALQAMGFPEEQIDAAAKACGGTHKATADDLVQWILEREGGAACGLRKDENAANLRSETLRIQRGQSERAKKEESRPKTEMRKADEEREAALAVSKRLAAKREEQRRINREWNNREQQRQREEAKTKFAEETERRRQAEIERVRMEALRQSRTRAQQQGASLEMQAMHGQGQGLSRNAQDAVGGINVLLGQSSYGDNIPTFAPQLGPESGLHYSGQRRFSHLNGGAEIFTRAESISSVGATSQPNFDMAMSLPLLASGTTIQNRIVSDNATSRSSLIQHTVDLHAQGSMTGQGHSMPKQALRPDLIGMSKRDQSGAQLRYPNIPDDRTYSYSKDGVKNSTCEPFESFRGDSTTTSNRENICHGALHLSVEPNHLGMIRATAKEFVPRSGLSSRNSPTGAAATPPDLGSGTAPMSSLDVAGYNIEGTTFNASSQAGMNGVWSQNGLLSNPPLSDTLNGDWWASAASFSTSLPHSGVSSPHTGRSQSPVPPSPSILATISPSLVASPSSDFEVRSMQCSHMHNSGSTILDKGDDLDRLKSRSSLFQPSLSTATKDRESVDPFRELGGNSIWSSVGVGVLHSFGLTRSNADVANQAAAADDGNDRKAINWGSHTAASSRSIW